MFEGKSLVFVVDDDQAVREALKFTLELEGLSVHACGGGAEMLEHADLPQAKCIVLDRKMPEMDGFDVVDYLLDAKIDTPVILIVSQASAAILRRARAAGIRHVLEKPLLDSALIDSIRTVLAGPA